jgi:predicted Co/Zn/Cd cation transporter (cation efflux family)
VDTKNWFINGAISSAVGFAFVLALFLQGSPVVPYIDSSLVILLVLVTIPIPLRMAIEGIGELLAVRPPDELMAQLDESLRKAIGENGRLERLRANQLGRTVVLIADTEVEQGRTAAELEAVQRSVEEQMRRSFPHLLMAIVFRTGSA